MEIILKHSFLHRCHNLDELLDNTNKLSTFINKLEKQSQKFPNRYDPDKYKGDGFELFVEALIKLSPVDNRIGIANYNPIKENEDIGVDGIGIGVDGNPATVQIKYRNNNRIRLSTNLDHLSNFTSASIMKYGVNPNTKNNLLIITTAEGLHHFTDKEMFLGKVRCLGYNQLRELVDNNILFWNAFRELIEKSK
ncbi:MAG: hypothetical protein ACOC1K_03390 [Nanoarchaeota archaeon]